MKTSTKIGFVILGAIVALAAIFLGDLRVVEQFLVGGGLAGLVAAFGIMGYNFFSNKSREDQGEVTKQVPFTNRVLFAITGAIMVVLISVLI